MQKLGIESNCDKSVKSLDLFCFNERDFETFFELSGVGNVVTDPNTYLFTKVNNTFCKLTGYSGEELSRLTPFDITHPEDRERDKNGWLKCLKQGDSHFEIEKRYIRKDGHSIWVNVTSTIVRNDDGTPAHAIGVIRDISAHRHALEEIEQARCELEQRVTERTRDLANINQMLATLIDASPLAIVAFDAEQHITIWNHTAEKLFGWKEEEVLGSPLPNLPGDPHTAEQMAELFLTREAFSIDTFRKCRDGSLMEVRVWHAPIYSPNGQFTGHVGLLMDITETRFLESALLEATEREQRRIGQDLHNHLCQHLLGAAFAAKALAGSLENTPAAEQLDGLARNINEAVGQMRDIARGLHPVELDSAGLMSSLQELTHRISRSTPCKFICHDTVLVENPKHALHAYRIVQEAVAFVLHDLNSRAVFVTLSQQDNAIALEVRGERPSRSKGSSPEAKMDEKIIEYRARAIGGHLTIKNVRQDVCINCCFPGVLS